MTSDAEQKPHPSRPSWTHFNQHASRFRLPCTALRDHEFTFTLKPRQLSPWLWSPAHHQSESYWRSFSRFTLNVSTFEKKDTRNHLRREEMRKSVFEEMILCSVTLRQVCFWSHVCLWVCEWSRPFGCSLSLHHSVHKDGFNDVNMRIRIKNGFITSNQYQITKQLI